MFSPVLDKFKHVNLWVAFDQKFRLMMWCMSLQCDKVSLLGDAIEYVKELQQRVREIQPGRCQAETTKRKGSEYINKETSNAEMRPKVTDANNNFSQQGNQCEEVETYKDREQTSECLPVEVTMEEDVAVLRIRCPGRSGLLIDILQKFVNLQLEVFSVKAAITKGILTTILKAKASLLSCAIFPSCI